tara:strand:- start:36 stop:659 length:624 start_codon:yes stop_codon:yes gene_type:complete
MNDIQIHDNFLTQTEYEALYNVFNSHEVNWYYDDFINSPIDDDSDYNFQFVHPIYHYNENGPLFLEDSENWYNRLRLIKSSHKKLIDPILSKLNVEVLLRMKFNMNIRTNEIIESNFHVDIGKSLPYLDLNPNEYKIAIFYLNNNDGYTLFECGEKIESVANRVVIFDGKLKHCGTSCTNQKNRIVLNINYIDKPEKNRIHLDVNYH